MWRIEPRPVRSRYGRLTWPEHRDTAPSPLDQGANAVEIDVTAYAHDLNALCIDHAGLLGDDPGRASAPAFEPFLRELRQVVDRRPELCMVEFDLKPPASRPELGPVLSGAIRDILTRETTLSVMVTDP